MKKFLISILMFVIMICSGCSTPGVTKKDSSSAGKQTELTISAAASLNDALAEIKSVYEKKHNNVHLSFNFGASGALEQQISRGAPVDLFFSAAKDKLDSLVQKGLIDKKQACDLVGNDLVLIVPKNEKEKVSRFEQLTDNNIKKIAIGTPESVPAGAYAKETLQNLRIWDNVQNKVVQAKDVRQVLSYVETGNVDAGLVYKTDALPSSKVKIVRTANEDTHQPIVYPLGIIKSSTHMKQAEAFYRFMQGDEALRILKKHGFKGLKQ
ncbi:molybdate ABC transporter substrate-binding protein [Fictibacillus gelatini]|uniref:molybdate ABC transporter substrate-binding protein n=1 Tax=Fictibacillus gelatini TaxID=225985 RepID=UPI0003FE576D|nr:molybdate ABC transporter substrate-binding protein [Fictibacillus gelatini]